MNLHQIMSKYTWHDSLIESISYDDKGRTLSLDIDFCNWKQKNYFDDMPETTDINIKFIDVNEFSIDNETYSPDSDEILDVELIRNINGEGVLIKAYNSSDIISIIVFAESVEILGL